MTTRSAARRKYRTRRPARDERDKGHDLISGREHAKECSRIGDDEIVARRLYRRRYVVAPIGGVHHRRVNVDEQDAGGDDRCQTDNDQS